MERTVHAGEENPEKENVMKVWKDYTTDNANVVLEKAVKPSSPKNKFLQEKTVLRCNA